MHLLVQATGTSNYKASSLQEKYNTKLCLQEASIFGTEEQPLDTEQGILCDLGVLVIHELHHPLFCLQICHYNPATRVVLHELRQVIASNSECRWIV